MADETESLPIRLLQEAREAVRRTDGNTLVFKAVASVIHRHDDNTTDLEQHGG